MISQQAARIIHKFGGVGALAEAIGHSRWAVYRWTYSRERKGTDGLVPAAAVKKIREAAARLGLVLTAEDWDPLIVDQPPKNKRRPRRAVSQEPSQPRPPARARDRADDAYENSGSAVSSLGRYERKPVKAAATPKTTSAPTFLTPKQLAERWAVSLGSLANNRYRRIGVPFVMLGPTKLRYRYEDVLAYEANAKRVETRR